MKGILKLNMRKRPQIATNNFKSVISVGYAKHTPNLFIKFSISFPRAQVKLINCVWGNSLPGKELENEFS